MYEQSRALESQYFQRWLSSEVLSWQWFVMVGFVLTVYIVWIWLLDKKRIVPLMLLGSLAAVAYTMENMVLNSFNGAVEFLVRITPLQPELFIMSVTISPIAIMLVEQYTSSWKGYLLWTGIAFAFMCFAVYPFYIHIGIAVLHNWNMVYHYIMIMAISVFVRAVFIKLAAIQKRYSEG
jgi:hypothetical protein